LELAPDQFFDLCLLQVAALRAQHQGYELVWVRAIVKLHLWGLEWAALAWVLIAWQLLGICSVLSLVNNRPRLEWTTLASFPQLFQVLEAALG
jgi:hypothetical protein